MRRVIALALLCCAASAIGPSVAFAEGEKCSPGRSGSGAASADSADCSAGGVASRPGSSDTRRSNNTTAKGPQQRYIYFETVSQDSEGNRCIATTARPIRDGSQVEYTARSILEDLPPCPGAREAESPESLAADYWQRVTLPSPRPAIAPGWAITGKYAYLETRGELRKTFSTDTPFGPLTIEARGVYLVDWGDGATTGPHSVEGEPWPDGEITHTYIDVGIYDVVVTQRWSAIWHFGASSGSLSQLRTFGRIDDLRVEQVQAVVRPG